MAVNFGIVLGNSMQSLKTDGALCMDKKLSSR